MILSNSLRACFLCTNEGVQVSLDSVPSAARSGHGSARMMVVRLLARRSSWRNAVALSWAPAGTEPGTVSLSREPDRWTFTTDRGKFRLEWDSGKVQFAARAPDNLPTCRELASFALTQLGIF